MLNNPSPFNKNEQNGLGSGQSISIYISCKFPDSSRLEQQMCHYLFMTIVWHRLPSYIFPTSSGEKFKFPTTNHPPNSTYRVWQAPSRDWPRTVGWLRPAPGPIGSCKDRSPRPPISWWKPTTRSKHKTLVCNEMPRCFTYRYYQA